MMRRLRRLPILSLLLLALALLALSWPVDTALEAAGAGELRVLHALASIAAIGTVVAIGALLRGRTGLGLIAMLIALMGLVRAIYFGLVRFSGQGFTDEVFVHLEAESVRLAWQQYPQLMATLGIGVLLWLWAWVRFGRRLVLPPRPLAAAAMLPCLLVAAWASDALPEVQLAEAAWGFYRPQRLDLPEPALQRWRESGLVEVDLRAKHEVAASAPARPRNLVLLYLESVGLSVLRHPAYPDLMPNLAALVRKHAYVPHLHASAYITIEGIVNSQCGTLYPFEADSDAMAGADLLGESLTCLGDVLRAAGYRQSYLGGAGLGFAGKGVFLAAHGFDEAKGIEQWRSIGLSEREGTWGLSDADLFEQSHAELAALRAAGRPFNLTLLTIGTHLPGYRYAECAPYRDGEEVFLDALSCTDQLLGRWLERLRADGDLHDTLLVVTADHHVFPNPEMKRLFGEAAVLDRRLPLVVLGADRRPQAASGAQYDLAPTLLDLLGVEHDARFALGRSLLRTEGTRRHYFTRYLDIAGDVPVENAGADCQPANATTIRLPLDTCRKHELRSLLATQVASLSSATPRMQCRRVGGSWMRIPDEPTAPMAVRVGGRDLTGRFVWNGRPVAADLAGLYLVGLDAAGLVTERQYVSAEDAAQSAAPSAQHAWLVGWKAPAGGEAAAPPWLPPRTGRGGNGIWLLDGTTGQARLAGYYVQPDVLELVVDGRTCQGLFEPRRPLLAGLLGG